MVKLLEGEYFELLRTHSFHLPSSVLSCCWSNWKRTTCTRTNCSKWEREQHPQLTTSLPFQKAHKTELRISRWDWRTWNTREKVEFSSLITSRHSEPKMKRQLRQPYPLFLFMFFQDKLCPPQNQATISASPPVSQQHGCSQGTHPAWINTTHIEHTMKINHQLLKRTWKSTKPRGLKK